MAASWRRSGIIYIFILLAGAALATLLFSGTEKPKEIPLSQVITMSENHQIKEVTVDGQWLTIIDTSDATLRSFKGDTSVFEIKGLDLTGILLNIQPGGFDWGSLLLGLLPLMLFGALLFFLLFRVRGANNQAMSFGRSRARLTPAVKAIGYF